MEQKRCAKSVAELAHSDAVGVELLYLVADLEVEQQGRLKVDQWGELGWNETVWCMCSSLSRERR